jgi:hypothetical protein
MLIKIYLLIVFLSSILSSICLSLAGLFGRASGFSIITISCLFFSLMLSFFFYYEVALLNSPVYFKIYEFSPICEGLFNSPFTFSTISSSMEVFISTVCTNILLYYSFLSLSFSSISIVIQSKLMIFFTMILLDPFSLVLVTPIVPPFKLILVTPIIPPFKLILITPIVPIIKLILITPIAAPILPSIIIDFPILENIFDLVFYSDGYSSDSSCSSGGSSGGDDFRTTIWLDKELIIFVLFLAVLYYGFYVEKDEEMKAYSQKLLVDKLIDEYFEEMEELEKLEKLNNSESNENPNQSNNNDQQQVKE